MSCDRCSGRAKLPPFRSEFLGLIAEHVLCVRKREAEALVGAVEDGIINRSDLEDQPQSDMPARYRLHTHREARMMSAG